MRAMQGLPAALGPKARQHLESLFEAFLPACLRFLRRELEEISPTEDTGVAVTAMRVLDSCLDDYVPRERLGMAGSGRCRSCN